MRSFHNSGSSTLSINSKLEKYIRDHLTDFQLLNDKCNLIFNTEIDYDIQIILQAIPGHLLTVGNCSSFGYIYDIENEDVGKVIRELKTCLLTEKIKHITPINETYDQLVRSILSVGDIFSTFIEIVLCNLYTNDKDKIIRYQLKDGEKVQIDKKYSVYHIHSLLSPTLNLLYKPNLKTISEYYNATIAKEGYKSSIFEKIWLNI
jgi:hypothetical protein